MHFWTKPAAVVSCDYLFFAFGPDQMKRASDVKAHLDNKRPPQEQLVLLLNMTICYFFELFSALYTSNVRLNQDRLISYISVVIFHFLTTTVD